MECNNNRITLIESLQTIPIELAESIFLHMSLADICTLSKTCVALRQLIQSLLQSDYYAVKLLNFEYPSENPYFSLVSTGIFLMISYGKYELRNRASQIVTLPVTMM